MESLFNLTKEYKIKEAVNSFKNKKDELIFLMVEDINKLREGTKFRKETTKGLAIRVNSNPFLKDTDELELLYKECRDKRNYSKLYWLCPLNKKK